MCSQTMPDDTEETDGARESGFRRGDDRTDNDAPGVDVTDSGDWLHDTDDDDVDVRPIEEMTEEELREEFGEDADEIIRELRESDKDTVV